MKQMVLNFHGVGEPPANVAASEAAYWLDHITFNGLLDQIRAAVEHGMPIAITFDDGNVSDARIAMPELVRRDLTARFFVCAGRIDRVNYLDKAALADLVGAGMGIGSHGMHHVDWRRVSDADLEEETGAARRRLEDVCGCRIDEAAIPFGSYDRRVIAKLRQQNWRHIYTSDGGFAAANAWLKPRISLSRNLCRSNTIDHIRERETAWMKLLRKVSSVHKRVR